ncbi:MAG: carbamoyltransferase HypF [Mariprofundaceae bacterium]
MSQLKVEFQESAAHFTFPDGIGVSLGGGGQAVVATGVDLKNSLCMTAHDVAELSGVMGDINDPAVYEKVADILNQTTGIDAVACDLHPDLHATRLAFQLSERMDVPLIQVQHHHAHIAAVMAEFEIEGAALGLALDGYGYGTDASAWGGECLYVHGDSFERVGCLKPVAMPGGDAASREPWRMAVAWLNDEELSGRLFSEFPVKVIQSLCDSENRSKTTSSAGRLFDAASAIVLGKTTAAFEGEAAIALEKAAAGAKDADLFSYQLEQTGGELQLDCSEVIFQLADAVLNDDTGAGLSQAELSASFHKTVAAGFADLAIRSAAEKGVKNIVLAGGCFLNVLLNEQVTQHLESAGLKVFCSQKLPCGDGAIALGQAWVALQKLQKIQKLNGGHI